MYTNIENTILPVDKNIRTAIHLVFSILNAIQIMLNKLPR